MRINLNKGGVSLSGGVRGAHVTIGTSGINTSIGIPGTGISLRERIPIPLSTPRPSVHKAFSVPTLKPSIHEPSPVSGTGLLPDQLPSSMWALIENKPRFWWILLFQEGLNLIIEQAKPEWERATKIGMDESRFRHWVHHKMDQLTNDVNRLSNLWSVDFPEGLGGNGVHFDEKKIGSSLDELAALVEDLIGWEEEVRGFVDHPLYGDIASCIGGATKAFLDALEGVKTQLGQQIPRLPEGGLDLVMRFNLPGGWKDNVSKAIDRLKAFSTEQREVAPERVQVARGDKVLGFFGLRSIQENLEAGLFVDDDWFWSVNHNDWCPMKDLNAFCSNAAASQAT